MITNNVASSNVGSIPNTAARELTIEISGLPTTKCILRRTNPSQDPIKAVILGSGGPGNTFFADSTGGTELINSLLAEGITVFDRTWFQPGWFSNGLDIKLCSERYLDLIEFVHNIFEDTTGIGNSGGSCELGYYLTNPASIQYLSKVILCSGPPMARLDWAITTPPSSEWENLAATLKTQYELNWTYEITANPGGMLYTVLPTVPGYPGSLEEMSVLNPGAVLSSPFPVYTIVGSQDTSLSVPFGALMHDSWESDKEFIIADAPHFIPETAAGRQAILNAVLAD